MIGLTFQVYIRNCALKSITDIGNTSEYNNYLQNAIDIGQAAEIKIITFTDTLLAATNPCHDPKNSVAPEKHPCSVNTSSVSKENLDYDYETIFNCRQTHV